MPSMSWKKSEIRRKLAGRSKRVKNKRFYQEYGRLVMFHYAHLGIWYVLKLALLAKYFLKIEDDKLFAKVHVKRKPELYDLIYHVISCERDIQAIILQRSVKQFLHRRRLLRKLQEPKAMIIQKWWRQLLKSKIYPEKFRKLKEINERSVSTQTTLQMTDVAVQTNEPEREPSAENTLRQIIANAARIRTIQEGLGYIISTLAKANSNENYLGRICDEVTPVALALQEAAVIDAPDSILRGSFASLKSM